MFDKRRKTSNSLAEIQPGQADKDALLHQEQALDEALRESFPASDPVAVSFGCIINTRKADVRTP